MQVLENSFEVSIDLVSKRDPAIAPSFTAKQGQYLAFIHHYSKIHRQAPSEVDLERNGLIEKTPGMARSIRLLVLPKHLPRLE